MEMEISEIDKWFSEGLDEIQEGIVANAFKAIEAKRLLSSNIREMRAELTADGVDQGATHWDLIMNDGEDTENAIYIYFGFTPESLTLVLGRAEKWDIISVTDAHTLHQAVEVSDALKEKTIEFKELIIERAVGELWCQPI